MEPSNSEFHRRFSQKKVAVPKYQQEKSEIYEKILIIPKQKGIKEITFIIQCLKKHFMFYNLSDLELENIVNKMFYCQCEKDEYVFKQDENASSFFIIEKGQFEVIVHEKPKRIISTSESFGELALLYNAPRSASIRSKEISTLWGIDRNTFRKAVEEMVAKEYEFNRSFIDDIAFFQNLTTGQKNALASVLYTQKFSKGQPIVVEGDPASSYYIIKEGSVSVMKGDKEVRKLFKGETFGEAALYSESMRTMTVIASEENVKLLALGRDNITKILGDKIQNIIYRNSQKWAMENNQLLKNLTKIQIEKLNDVFRDKSYKTGDVLIKKGEIGLNKLFIVLQGAIKYGDELFGIRTFFHELFLLKSHKKKELENSLIVDQDSVIAEITTEEFERIIGGSIEEILKKNETSHEKKMMKLENPLKNESKTLNITDFLCVKKLGFGQFGSVYLVQPKKRKELYALKCVSKQQILEQNLEKHLQQERMVLDIVNFPFIMQFMRTYKDDFQVYFLLEYIKGMELFDVIRDIGLLSTYDSQFYIGSMILAIEYLHAQSIIYRDIKPENIMIDENGYLKMIDMGTAKILKGVKSGRTFTIIGTPHYMAPEIITGKGYNYLVDLWSIGVCLYEFMCGAVPFGEEAEDPYEIYEEVIKKPLTYPNYVKDKNAKKVMEQLLSKIPEIRLGSSYASLKANVWFSSFDWDKLLDKELKPPYIPPKNKMINDKEIEKLISTNKLVIDEIKAEQKGLKVGSPLGKKQNPDANWDKEFGC